LAGNIDFENEAMVQPAYQIVYAKLEKKTWIRCKVQQYHHDGLAHQSGSWSAGLSSN